jgi:hypothetical protein
MLLAFATMLNSNKGTKRDMAISLIPFDRLDFSDFGYPQNGAPFSPPILGVEFRCCLAASRPRSHTLESEPERKRFAGRADSIGWTYQDDSERSSPGKRMRRRRGGANRLINCRRHPPTKVLLREFLCRIWYLCWTLTMLIFRLPSEESLNGQITEEYIRSR